MLPRYPLAAYAFAVFITVFLISHDAHSRRLPPGSYQDTCSNCRMEDGILRCECQTRNGQWTPSSLGVFGCQSEIQNIDGQLQCQRGPFPAPPPGSYKKTCRNCTYNNWVLECECQTRDSLWQSTALETSSCRSEVWNENGNLRCKGRPGPGGRLPPGSYKNSCENCQADARSLECVCRRADGSRQKSRLGLRNCMEEVSNCNGNLTCGDCR